jgi:general transcription factor 3C polypeptide 3 (transcription factor C subunit 4)
LVRVFVLQTHPSSHLNSACASSAGRYDVAVQHVRKLIYVHQFNNEPVRVLLASLAGSIRSSDSFINTAFQKHVYREIRIADAAAKNRDSLSWFPAKKRYGLVKGKGKAAAADEDEDEDEEAGSDEDVLGFVPAKFNPVPVTLYGQMCNVAKSYQSAICMSSCHTLQQAPLTVWCPVYLLHAYDYCPQDPVICLTLGIAYLGRAMQRQSDNRHHLVAQVRPLFQRSRSGLSSQR